MRKIKLREAAIPSSFTSQDSDTASVLELSELSGEKIIYSDNEHMAKSKTRKEKREERPFAKNLTQLMAEKKMTLKMASEICGVSTSTISDWKSGTTPEDFLAVQALASSLGVSLTFLLTGKEDPNRREIPAIAEVFKEGDALFDGYALISIKRLIPRKPEK